jgi:hypothetical protein
MKRYGYRRSTTSHKARIALNLKGLACETAPVDPTTEERHVRRHTALNPGQGVPRLVLDDGTVPTQPMAKSNLLKVVHRDAAVASMGHWTTEGLSSIAQLSGIAPRCRAVSAVATARPKHRMDAI